MARELSQQMVWTGRAVIVRTVRAITEWDGRTVGVVRTFGGAEHVVQYVRAAERWDVLHGVSATEIGGR